MLARPSRNTTVTASQRAKHNGSRCGNFAFAGGTGQRLERNPVLLKGSSELQGA